VNSRERGRERARQAGPQDAPVAAPTAPPSSATNAPVPPGDPTDRDTASARLRGVLRATLSGARGGTVRLLARVGRQRALACTLVLLLLASPWPPLTLLALCAYIVVAFNQPGLTTALIPLTAPFAYRPKDLLGPDFPVIELLLLIALATSGLHLLLRWRREARQGLGAATLLDLWDEARKVLGTPFGLQAAALAALGAVSLLTVADPAHLRESLREYRTIVIEPVLFFFLARLWLRDRERRTSAIAAFIGGAALVSLLAIGQVLTGQGVVAVEGVRRALGPYDHPNALALYLLRAATFAIALLALAPAPRRARPLLVATPLLLLALALTFSRGAWLGLAVGVALLGLAFGLRRAAPGLLLAGVIGVALLALAGAGLNVFREGGESLGLRRMIWGSTVAMLRDHPAFGVGLDQFLTQYAPRYINPAAWGERYTSHPHNLLLDFWVRLGIMGFAWLVWTLTSLGLGVARAWHTAQGESRRLLLAAALACAAALTHGLVDNFYFLIDLAFIWWLLLALLSIATEDVAVAQSVTETAPPAPPRRGRARGSRRRLSTGTGAEG